MKLKALEVVGFKSFVDRLHLVFPGGITSIVGPNGCGKSNIVDAILWVIGERSAKHLRGRCMEDIIFNGTDGRKPLGMAEVNMTFSNEDGNVPEGYESYNEITVTRRLFRSGESEYLINKTPCRLRDITDLLLDTGIGINGYSIVEQGRVEYLINANPQDRRFLIEEAAGIAKYKERKRLALLKMEATQQNLLRIQDITAEVKRQIASLERQVKRAEEYKAVRKEVKEIELRFALQEYGELSEKGEATKGYLKALRDREMEISSQTAQKEASLEGMKLRGMEEEEKLRSVQQEVFGTGQRIQKLESEVESFRRERGSLFKRETQMMEEVKSALLSRKAAQRERRRYEEAMQILEKEYREGEEILREWETIYSEYRTTFQEISDQLENEKGGLVNSLTRLTSFKNRQSHLEERMEDLRERIASHEKETEEVTQEITRLEGRGSEVERERERNLSIRSAFQEEKEKWEREIQRSRELLRGKQEARIALEEKLRQDRSRYLSLKELQENYEGFEKGVKAILLKKKEDAEKWKTILGVVADIFEPEPRYEIALEAVLGERLQYLIVQEEKDAVESVAFLKRESAGRGSFVPVKVSGEGRADFPAVAGAQGLQPLLHFVSVREGFGPIAEYLIRDVGVVERLEDGVHRLKEEPGFRMLVTLEGDVLERSGVISGGSRDQGLGFLERRREIRVLEKNVGEEEQECQKALEEEERFQQDILEREARLERRKRELQDKEIEILHQEKDLEVLRKEIAQSQEKRTVLRHEGQQLQEERTSIEEERQAVLIQMNGEEQAKQAKESELQSLKNTVEEVREGTEELGAKITERKVIMASLEEKQRGMKNQAVGLSESLRTLREQVIKKADEIRECRSESASLLEGIEQRERELEEAIEKHRVLEEALSVQREKVEMISKEWKEFEASSKYLRQELEEVRQKIHEEGIRASEIQLRLSHLQESMKERYGAILSTAIGGGADLPREQMEKRLAELKVALEGFGEVNLLAIEEYQELKKRHDFLTEQQSDLQQALDSLRKAIARINRTTAKRFLETFQLVNERFKEVFTRLFRGGQASLLLLEEENPSTSGIDIIAQPPGKKLQNINLLSGGEKALVAIALLFGLFMIKPTPFFLLDEIDAPLDDANIDRFTNLVKDFSKKSQFLLITHNKKTMEMANTLYGITMENPGVSKVVSVRLN